MWWRIYYWFNIILCVLAFLAFFAKPNSNSFYIILLLNFGFEIFALYRYIYTYKKDEFSFTFWKVYLWVNVAIDVLYALYKTFPHTPIIQLFSFLALSDKPESVLELILVTLVDVPLFYAIYQLSQGKHLEQKESKTKTNKWKWWKTLLWLYSTIYITFWLLIFLLLYFYPISSKAADPDSVVALVVGLLSLPVLIFLMIIGKENLS